MKRLFIVAILFFASLSSWGQVRPFGAVYTENIYKNNFGYSIGFEFCDKVSIGYLNQRGSLQYNVGNEFTTSKVHTFEGLEARYKLLTIDNIISFVPSIKYGAYTLGDKGGDIIIPGFYVEGNIANAVRPMIGVSYTPEYTQPTATIRLEFVL